MTLHQNSRTDWIDLARGVAMIMVVFGHALIGVTTSLGTTHLSRFFILLIYCIHMPVLFALAGLLSHSLMARPLKAFARQMLERIFWPYILWSSLLLLLHFTMGDHTNSVIEVYRPLSIFLHPPAVMWFLYVMFCAIVLRRLLQGHTRLSCAIGVICICLPYFVEFQNGHLRFVGLYLLASVIPKGALVQGPRQWILTVAVPSAFLMIWFAWRDSTFEWTGYPGAAFTYFPTLVLSPLLVFAAARAAVRCSGASVLKKSLQALGRHSMAIFVLHIFFTAGVRIVLIRLGVSDIWVLTMCCTFVGVLAPFMVAWLSSRWRLGPLLGWQNV